MAWKPAPELQWRDRLLQMLELCLRVEAKRASHVTKVTRMPRLKHVVHRFLQRREARWRTGLSTWPPLTKKDSSYQPYPAVPSRYNGKSRIIVNPPPSVVKQQPTVRLGSDRRQSALSRRLALKRDRLFTTPSGPLPEGRIPTSCCELQNAEKSIISNMAAGDVPC